MEKFRKVLYKDHTVETPTVQGGAKMSNSKASDDDEMTHTGKRKTTKKSSKKALNVISINYWSYFFLGMSIILTLLTCYYILA